MSSSMNKYWIPHQDIHRKVITQELQCYLGPQATVRPYTLEGEDGFLISTPGSCLTDVGHCGLVKELLSLIDTIDRNKSMIFAESRKIFGIDKPQPSLSSFREGRPETLIDVTMIDPGMIIIEPRYDSAVMIMLPRGGCQDSGRQS
ncbi:hypothetical protein FPSE_03685 [Fusarium pseudograminearum CS3096]|uniref:Uncharacterized protein n=1 Tax=Fusarium pseudograminearum (strain CS3096) TaxID=1028729 RepID=K3W1N5_FUSPC|nr:hypothetical protein FPSE_03685 [Fusarium pseudograminearum CS3096]EKJ76210.1 hypothetical protein FPSE_03685 [Fusarium pseudograminearum CS3096]